jgi:hypothetical protein
MKYRSGLPDRKVRVLIDAKVNPHLIDFVLEKSCHLGLFRVSEEKLTLTLDMGPENKRPRLFATAEDGSWEGMVLKKAKT